VALTRENILHLNCRLNRAVLAIVAAAALAGAWRLTAQTQSSLWDGVYTDEQATRGSLVYTDQCARCHGADLTGGDEVPPLTGGQFLSNWNTLSVNDLFERIRISMPADKPGKLSRQQVADILAYILSLDKFPSGKVELGTQAEALKQIRFEAFKP
jgi:S-disulfanyl-L-cysteine oxidoreductase SoxD